jgi:hypothetical protein
MSVNRHGKKGIASGHETNQLYDFCDYSKNVIGSVRK